MNIANNTESKPTWNWNCVPEGSGVLAIRSKSTGRSYFLGVSNMRQRGYDHFRLLTGGTHHNDPLQAAWTSDPSDFEFVAVERVAYPKLLGLFKQVWIERTPGCWNKKNAVAVRRAKRPATGWSAGGVGLSSRPAV